MIKGKHKPTYTPNKEEGDTVVVTNIKNIIFTGKKWTQKVYKWHTGWHGGLKVHQKCPRSISDHQFLGTKSYRNICQVS